MTTPALYAIDAPEDRLTDGVVALAPTTLSDTEAVMQWDADPEIQHFYDWPLTVPWDAPATHDARREKFDKAVHAKLRADR